jgi:hypothetical protein
MSEQNRSAESYSKPNLSQFKGNKSYFFGVDDEMPEPDHPERNDNVVQSPISIPTSQPVKDLRTTSPTTKRRTNGFESERVNGIGHKTKAKGRHEASNPSQPAAATESKERHVETHNRKSNGISLSSGAGGNDHSHPNPASGWQTMKKKYKKGAKSPAEQNQTHINGAEPLPADEALRKGG